jgi:hypothetical protein
MAEETHRYLSELSDDYDFDCLTMEQYWKLRGGKPSEKDTNSDETG